MNTSLLRTVSMMALLALGACAQPTDDPNANEPTPLTEKESNLLQLGLKVEKGGDVESAIGFYKKAMEKSDGNVDGHLALSRVYIDQNKYLQAQEVLEKAKAIQPNNAEVNLRLGKIAIRRQEPKLAMMYFEDGLKELPGNVDLLNGKGVALDMMARHEEAQLQYRQALAGAKTQYPFVDNNLAMSYIMTGKYDEAIDVLQGIADVGTSPVMRQNLALAYGLKGDMEKAKEWGGKDLTETQMNENIAFYQNYVEQLQNEHEQAVPAPDVVTETLVPSNVTSGEIQTTTEIQPLVPTSKAAPIVEKQVEAPIVAAEKRVPVASPEPVAAPAVPVRTEIPVTPMETRKMVPAAPTVMSTPEAVPAPIKAEVVPVAPAPVPAAIAAPAPVVTPAPATSPVKAEVIPVAPVAPIVPVAAPTAPAPAPVVKEEAPAVQDAAPASGAPMATTPPATLTKHRALPWMTE